MKYLNQWGKGKPLGLIIMAQQLAVSTKACFEFLRLIKSGEKIEAHSAMINPLLWIHVLSWIYNIIIRAYRQFRDGSSSPRYIGGGMYTGAALIQLLEASLLGQFQLSARHL